MVAVGLVLLPPFAKLNLFIFVLLPLMWFAVIISMWAHRKNVTYLVVILPLFLFLTFNALFYFSIIYYGVSTIITGNERTWIDGSREVYRRFFNVDIIGKRDYGHPVIFTLNNNHIGNFFDIFGLDLVDDKAKIIMSDLPIITHVVPTDRKILLPLNTRNMHDFVINRCRQEVSDGNSIIVFPEGKHALSKTENWSWKHLAKFQTGIFEFAFDNKVPIVPVITESYRSFHYILFPGTYRIHFLDEIHPEEASSVDDLKKICRERMNEKMLKL